MTRPDNDDRLLLRVAQLYYEKGLTQAEIAGRVHVTRWKVGRMLEEARQTGIVRIEIVHRYARCHAEEIQLKQTYELDDAVVVPTVESLGGNRRNVAAAAAEYLADLRPQPKVVAVSWGQTMDDLADQIPPGWARGVTVVQANGGLSRTGRAPAVTASVELARQGVGTAIYLPAPAIVETAALGAALSADASVRKVLEMARAADVILYSASGLTPNGVIVGSGYLQPSDLDDLRAKHAVGDVFARFVDADGHPVDSQLETRTIGLSVDDMRRAKLPVAVVSGPEKAEVSRALVRGGLCRVLICDQVLAQMLLAPDL